VERLTKPNSKRERALGRRRLSTKLPRWSARPTWRPLGLLLSRSSKLRNWTEYNHCQSEMPIPAVEDGFWFGYLDRTVAKD
jgi:hypothetical protein